MSTVASRTLAKINKHGELFTVGANTYRGIFYPASDSILNEYMSEIEVSEINKPGLVVHTYPDAVIVPTDTITRNAIVYIVERTYKQRVAGVAIYLFVLLGD